MIWSPFPLLAVLALLMLSPPAFARHGGDVEAKLPSGMGVGASYHPGRKQLPTVLILHGLVLTRDFPTVGRASAQARGIAVSVIPDASHFFDNPYEFDLHDVVLQTVTGR